MNTSGPGALGVLKVKAEPGDSEEACQGLGGCLSARWGHLRGWGRQLTGQGAEWALRVHLRLDGDDALALWAPALLALGPHAEHVGVVGQEVLHHHRGLAGVGDVEAIQLT